MKIGVYYESYKLSTNNSCNTGTKTLFKLTAKGNLIIHFCLMLTGKPYIVAKNEISRSITAEIPEFTAPISNVTTPLGREAVLSCTVNNIAKYKVRVGIIFAKLNFGDLKLIYE